MSQNPGPPPVSKAVATIPDTRAAQNFDVIQATLRENRGEVSAIKAMFGGDKELMNRFLAVAFSALAKNPQLLRDATPASIIQSVKDAAAMGLEPTGLLGEGAIIAYGDVATFQPMWRGYLKRIRNSRKVLDIDCQIVYMNDEFDIWFGTDPGIRHKPLLFGERDEETGDLLNDRGGYRGAYAWALMPSGKTIVEWMPEADINQVRDQYSRAAKKPDSPWQKSWPEMARKTVIRRLAKRLPGEAVDQLLLADSQADAAADALRQATADADKASETLRNVALRAVGQLPEPAPDEPPAEAQGGSETEQAKLIEDAAKGDPGEDGEAALMCRKPSPYEDGQFCVLFQGHGGNHRGADKSTWN